MADCSGYGIGTRFTLCVDGPVGNGKRANLTILIDDAGRYQFNTDTPIVVSNWDGSALKINLDSKLSDGLNLADCDVTANLKVTPKGGTNGGTLLLEFVMSNCLNSGYPQIFENCGGAGPHVISEMSTFSLESAACPM